MATTEDTVALQKGAIAPFCRTVSTGVAGVLGGVVIISPVDYIF